MFFIAQRFSRQAGLKHIYDDIMRSKGTFDDRSRSHDDLGMPGNDARIPADASFSRNKHNCASFASCSICNELMVNALVAGLTSDDLLVGPRTNNSTRNIYSYPWTHDTEIMGGAPFESSKEGKHLTLFQFTRDGTRVETAFHRVHELLDHILS